MKTAKSMQIQLKKLSGESFYYTFDISGNFNVENQDGPYDSLKLSVDTYMMKKMDTLKKMVNEKSLKMTFECGFVHKDNTVLLNKIRDMNAYTIDWSNIPDYLSNPKDFLKLGKDKLQKMDRMIFSLFEIRKLIWYPLKVVTSALSQKIRFSREERGCDMYLDFKYSDVKH